MLPQVLTHAAKLRRALMPLGAQSIRLFGSVARGDDTESSDIDLLVAVEPDVGLFTLLSMQREAEEILGRPVDLVPSTGLKPGIADAIERDSIAL